MYTDSLLGSLSHSHNGIPPQLWVRLELAHSMGGKFMPPYPEVRLNFDGSNGYPLNGDPSASQADLSASI